MLAVSGLIVSILALVIGLYQWRRNRGAVRVELTEIQATIHVRVRADTPTKLQVQGIAYQVISGRPPLGRFLSSLRQAAEEKHITLRQRIAHAWFIHGFIAMGWCESVSTRNDGRRSVFAPAPIVGPALPTGIDPYDDASWAFEVIEYAHLFRTIRRFDRENPRIRFLATISGHWRRRVTSRWLDIRTLQAFSPDNAWLLERTDSGEEPPTS